MKQVSKVSRCGGTFRKLREGTNKLEDLCRARPRLDEHMIQTWPHAEVTALLSLSLAWTPGELSNDQQPQDKEECEQQGG